MALIAQEEVEALIKTVGAGAAVELNKQMGIFETKIQSMLTGTLNKAEFDAAQDAIKAAVEAVKEISRKQGVSINDMLARFDNGGTTPYKSIQEQLKTDKDELIEVYKSKNRSKEYMLNFDGKKWTMTPFDSVSKAAGPHATVADVQTSGNTPSVSQSFSAATLLRMATDSPINSVYRNTPWIFDLVNLINVGFDQRFFTWFDENVKQGTSAQVAEGATKPTVQYSYTLQSNNYLKEAMLVSFTQEFDLDFGRLEDDILQKARIDLVNRMNTAILGRLFTNATAYNSAATYAPTGDKIPIAGVNDWDVVAALAAQAETATYSTAANTVVVGTNKKYRMETIKDSQYRWLGMPPFMEGMAIVSNPDFTNTNVMVGDFKQYNVALRGGIIVKVGYNGTDFANNMFSVVIEQFYYDYISTMRKPAIVKGPDFATVKAAIAA